MSTGIVRAGACIQLDYEFNRTGASILSTSPPRSSRYVPPPRCHRTLWVWSLAADFSFEGEPRGTAFRQDLDLAPFVVLEDAKFLDRVGGIEERKAPERALREFLGIEEKDAVERRDSDFRVMHVRGAADGDVLQQAGMLVVRKLLAGTVQDRQG